MILGWNHTRSMENNLNPDNTVMNLVIYSSDMASSLSALYMSFKK